MNWLFRPASTQAASLAEVGWVLIVVCSAIFLRITERGLISIRDPGSGARDPGVSRFSRAPGPESRIPESMYPRMSCLVTRPPKPEPWI